MAAARAVAGLGLAALCIDIAPRPQPFGRDLARAMGAQYLALPSADSVALSAAAACAAGTGRR
jgi:magnesium chelatase subunit D